MNQPTHYPSVRHIFFLLSFIALILVISCNKDEEVVELTFTSWRTDDVDKMNMINALFSQTHKSISVKFDPIHVTEYDAAIPELLSKGEGADIIFLRPYENAVNYMTGVIFLISVI